MRCCGLRFASLGWLVPAVLVGVACADLGGLTEPAIGPSCDGGDCGESAAADAGVDAPCAPGDVSSFVPVWKPPTGRAQARCSATQAETFVGCLFSQAADDPSCKDYMARGDNAACAACVLSDLAASSYGPLVRLGPDAITVNVEGCVALLANDVKATGCGAKAQALAQCRNAACSPTCPLSDHASLVALDACQQAADKASCQSYLSASACIQPLLNGVAASCATAPTPLQAATNVVKIFCGS